MTLINHKSTMDNKIDDPKIRAAYFQSMAEDWYTRYEFHKFDDWGYDKDEMIKKFTIMAEEGYSYGNTYDICKFNYESWLKNQ